MGVQSSLPLRAGPLWSWHSYSVCTASSSSLFSWESSICSLERHDNARATNTVLLTPHFLTPLLYYGTFLCSVFILLSTLVDLEMQMVVVNDLSCCQSRSLCDCLRCRTPLLDTNKLKTEWVAYTCTICYQALRRPFIVIFCSSKARFACTPNAVTRRSNHGCGSHG